VTAGLAIYDTMQFVKNPIATYCIGQGAGMALLLLAAGTKGKRYALPHARLHFTALWSDKVGGPPEEMAKQAEEIARLRKVLHETFAKHTGQHVKWIEGAMAHDIFLTAAQGIESGLLDEVLTTLPH